MALEALLVLGLFAASLLPLVAWLQRAPSRGARLTGVAVWLGAAGVLTWAVFEYPRPVHDESTVENRPIEVSSDGYVSSRTCRACHPHNNATWFGS